MRLSHAASASAAVVLFAWSAAGAADVCVRCSGPSAYYRCVVDGDAAEIAGKLECVRTLALRGKHETCAVSPPGANACAGTVVRIETPAVTAERPGIAGSSQGERESGPGRLPQGQPVLSMAPQDQERGNPQEHPLNKVGQGINKAGEKVEELGSAVGNTAKKSWDCVTSLFKSC